MKKTIIGFLFVLGALVLRANDSYIYWLQDTATGNGVSVGGTYTARLVAIDNSKYSEWQYGAGTYLTLYKAGEGGTPNTATDYTSAQMNLADGGNTPRYADITSILGKGSYTYFVELFNEQNEIFARSTEGLSSENASAYVYTTDTGMAIPANGFTAPVFMAASAPEPTSGLLLLLGSAILALRRKRHDALVVDATSRRV